VWAPEQTCALALAAPPRSLPSNLAAVDGAASLLRAVCGDDPGAIGRTLGPVLFRLCIEDAAAVGGGGGGDGATAGGGRGGGEGGGMGGDAGGDAGGSQTSS
jgi:hypothetical protein